MVFQNEAMIITYISKKSRSKFQECSHQLLQFTAVPVQSSEHKKRRFYLPQNKTQRGTNLYSPTTLLCDNLDIEPHA